MIDYGHLELPGDLIDRFQAWQSKYDNSPPDEPLESERFSQTAEELARDLKRHVGPRVYVERNELVEVLGDGSTRDCRPLFGLPAV